MSPVRIAPGAVLPPLHALRVLPLVLIGKEVAAFALGGVSLEVLGVYHSHPRSAAVPSYTDRAEAFEHFIFVIVGLGSDPDLKAWNWAGGNFDPLPIVRCP